MTLLWAQMIFFVSGEIRMEDFSFDGDEGNITFIGGKSLEKIITHQRQ
jgi:hypothetical protein